MNRPASHFRSLPTEQKHALRLGLALRNLRHECGATGEMIALAANIARGFYNQLELGYCEPSMATLRRIAGAFNTTPSAILLLAESFSEREL